MRVASLFVLVLTFVVAAAAQAPAPAGGDPDQLYGDRAHLPSALDAAAIWAARLAQNPRDFESAWKLSRGCYWLGGHVAADERRRQYERGIDAGRKAVATFPARPEGHFWMAAN